MREQAAAASLVDSLDLVDLKDCMACSMVSGERFSHLTMTYTANGYRGHYVCMDREACMQRQLSGGGAMDGASAQAGAPVQPLCDSPLVTMCRRSLHFGGWSVVCLL